MENIKNFHHTFIRLSLLHAHHHQRQKERELLASGRKHSRIMKNWRQLVKMPVYLILMRRQESRPGLWCCRVLLRLGRPLCSERGHWTGWRGCSTRTRFITFPELQRAAPADKDRNTICWFDCPRLAWFPGLKPEILAQPERILFFLERVDELRLPCEQHTCDLLRLGRAATNAFPTEQFTGEDSASQNLPPCHHLTHYLDKVSPLGRFPTIWRFWASLRRTSRSSNSVNISKTQTKTWEPCSW